MNSVKKKILFLWILTNLTAMSLTGCGEKNNTYRVNYTSIEITWENDQIVSGTIPYEDIFGHIKVVILEQNGTIKPFLMIREKAKVGGARGPYYTNLSYIDLKTGVTLIKKHWNSSVANVEVDEPDSIPVGESLTILEEQEFYDYLFGLGEIRTEFDIDEIMAMYTNDIEPELLDYIEEEYKPYSK